MNDLPEALLAFFIGAAAFTGVLTIAARLAFKPIMESWLRLRQAAADDGGRLRQERRIEILEEELRELGRTVSTLTEAEEFRRRLEASPTGMPRTHELAPPRGDGRG